MEVIGGIILLLLVVWATISIVGSPAPTGTKALWILLILFLPLVGFLIWLFFGPKRAVHRQGSLDI